MDSKAFIPLEPLIMAGQINSDSHCHLNPWGQTVLSAEVMRPCERHWSDRGVPGGKICSVCELKQPLAVSYGTRDKSSSSALSLM